jgi:hypothetical protein
VILNPADALDFRCVPDGHFSRYFTTPAMCPRSGCGSRTLELAEPEDARRDRERAKAGGPSDTVRTAR